MGKEQCPDIDIDLSPSTPKKRKRSPGLVADPLDRETSYEIEASKSVKAPRSSALRRNTKGERLVVYLPPDLDSDLRVHSGRERQSKSWIVTEALREYLGARGAIGT